MAIESATEDQQAIRVVDQRGGVRLPQGRRPHRDLPADPTAAIAGIDLGIAAGGHQARPVFGPGVRDFRSSPAASFKVSSDGLVRIRLPGPAEVVVAGDYEPRYRQHVAHDFFLPDEQGGLAMYLISGEAREELPASWKAGWSVRYRLSHARRALGRGVSTQAL